MLSSVLQKYSEISYLHRLAQFDFFKKTKQKNKQKNLSQATHSSTLAKGEEGLSLGSNVYKNMH